MTNYLIYPGLKTWFFLPDVLFVVSGSVLHCKASTQLDLPHSLPLLAITENTAGLTWSVWPILFSGVVLTGGSRLARDVTRETSLVRLVLGSCKTGSCGQLGALQGGGRLQGQVVEDKMGTSLSLCETPARLHSLVRDLL